VLLQMEIPEAVVRAALEAARAKASQHSQHRTADRCGGASLAPLADIVIANETEFARLSGRPAESTGPR
jgi:ribokinase